MLGGGQGESVAKAQDALAAVTSKASELDKEYGLVGQLKDLLGKAGDLSVEVGGGCGPDARSVCVA